MISIHNALVQILNQKSGTNKRKQQEKIKQIKEEANNKELELSNCVKELKEFNEKIRKENETLKEATEKRNKGKAGKS